MATKRKNEVSVTKKNEVSVTKAKEILRDGTVHGRPLTARQWRYFWARADGK